MKNSYLQNLTSLFISRRLYLPEKFLRTLMIFLKERILKGLLLLLFENFIARKIQFTFKMTLWMVLPRHSS